jgi:hypothetical protein
VYVVGILDQGAADFRIIIFADEKDIAWRSGPFESEEIVIARLYANVNTRPPLT